MRRPPRQVVWSVAKLTLAGLVVGFVGWQFTLILSQEGLWRGLHERPLTISWPWVAASAGLYLAGLGSWGGFWIALVRRCGEPLPAFAGLRAYFISQLGKYVPGKALVVLLRVGLSGRHGVRPAVAALSGVYETLTAMASGALVAAALLPWTAASEGGLLWQSLLLLGIAGVPVLPGVFDRLAAKAARPFLPADAPPLPRPGAATLLRGLAQGAAGWLLMGASLWCFLVGLGLSPPGPAPLAWLRCTAAVAVAYVAGFLTIVSPGGLGVRELILQRILTPELAVGVGAGPAAALAVLAVLLLRLAWTAAEFTLAGLLYCLPGRTPER